MSLHEDLVDHVSTRDDVTLIAHPLVHTLYNPAFDAIYNRTYLDRKARIDKALEDGDVRSYVNFHEKPYRLQAFLRAYNSGLLDRPKDYWPLLGYLWGASENIRDDRAAWAEAWAADIPDRHLCMSKADRMALESLPETFLIMRGYQGNEFLEGMSWTVSEAIARWFASRSKERPSYVAKGFVSKNDVLAYFPSREAEIVVPFDRIEHMTVSF